MGVVTTYFLWKEEANKRKFIDKTSFKKTLNYKLSAFFYNCKLNTFISINKKRKKLNCNAIFSFGYNKKKNLQLESRKPLFS
jgi:hypothetical protein